MPSRSPKDALEHICHNIDLARRFVVGLDFAAFKEDDLVFYALTRCLEIISEASRRLPPELKHRHPEIAWSAMAGAGNVYRHDYEDVQQRLVWGTMVERFPALLAMVEPSCAVSTAANDRSRMAAAQ